MAAPTRTPRDSWIQEGLRALAAGGPDAVRVETLAQALGVTKGGFYWHFEDRPALLEEMLDTWERELLDEVIERVETRAATAGQSCARLFSLAGAIGERLKIELAVRDWARRDKAVARRLRRVDNRRMDYMRPLFAEFCADDDDAEARTHARLLAVRGQQLHGGLARRALARAGHAAGHRPAAQRTLGLSGVGSPGDGSARRARSGGRGAELTAAEARRYLEGIDEAPVLAAGAQEAIDGWSDPMPERGDGTLAALTELAARGATPRRAPAARASSTS